MAEAARSVDAGPWARAEDAAAGARAEDLGVPREIKFHGRPLLPYERMAQKMLDRLRRMLGQGG